MTSLLTDLPASLENLLDKFLEDNPQPLFRFRTLDANQHIMPIQGPDGVTPAVVNPARILPGGTKIRTPEGKMLHLLYWEKQQQTTVNGVMTILPEPEPIIFEPREFCIKEVPRSKRELLARLLFSNECRNGLNPAKEEPVSGYVYELIEPAKTAEQTIAAKERILYAQQEVLKATAMALTLACQRLDLPVSDDRNVNADTLFERAAKDPESVNRVLTDAYDKTVALVRELLAADVIAFDGAARHYLTTHDRKSILDVPQGDFEKALVKHLSDTQGQKLRVSLVRRLTDKTTKE